jgi:MFS family permease
MVFPALPVFQREFGATAAWTTWVLTGFIVSAAVATPILGCLGAAFAWDLWSLIGFRVISGAGGALFPLAFAIIRDEMPIEKVKVGIGLISAVWGVGGGFGIVLSGVIVDHFSWRLLFLLGSIPVAISIALVHRYVPESPIRTPSRVDVPGALLLTGALVSFMVALTEGDHWGWGSAPVLGLLALSLAFFAAWGLVEARSSSPMVDLQMLVHRPVLLTNIASLVSGFAMFNCFLLIPQFVQASGEQGYGFGASATMAGLFLLPSSVAMLFSGPLAGTIGRRIGSKWPLAGGMLITGLSAAMLAGAHHEAWHLYVASALLGIGVGAAFSAMAALIADHVDADEMGVASGMNTLIRLVGSVTGGQVAAALLTAKTIGSTSIPAESAYTISFALSALAAVASAAIALGIGTQPLRRRLAPAAAHR